MDGWMSRDGGIAAVTGVVARFLRKQGWFPFKRMKEGGTSERKAEKADRARSLLSAVTSSQEEQGEEGRAEIMPCLWIGHDAAGDDLGKEAIWCWPSNLTCGGLPKVHE